MEGEKLKLVIDYDNTMVNSSRTIINKLHWKNRHDRDNSFSYDPKELQLDFSPYAKTEEDRLWCVNQFNEQSFYDDLEPMRNCKEVLKKLHDKYEIIVCSNRSSSNAEMFLMSVHNLFGDLIDKIIIVDDFNKGEYIKADIRIDDKVDCMNDEESINILFGDYGYNRYDDVCVNYRVKGWSEVLRIIRECENSEK